LEISRNEAAYPGAPATAQNQTTMITFGPTIATPRIAQKFRK
jgi:hypothetical protein